MSNYPKITVITPSYNQGDYLERTIQSVINQGYPNLEYMVIDGGSTDNSVDIIKQYADQIDWWVSEKDEGQTHAINKGLQLATGDIIAYLNSDDTYIDQSLFCVAKHFTQSNIKWLVGQCDQIDPDDNTIGALQHRMPENFASYLRRDSGLIPQPSSFWAKDTFKNLGHFRRDLVCCFDYEWNCRLLNAGFQPHMIDTPLTQFRIHPESKGETLSLIFGRERITVAELYTTQLDTIDQRRLKKRLGYNKRQYAIKAAQFGQESLWSHVIRKPWWIGSQQIREALFHPTQEKAA